MILETTVLFISFFFIWAVVVGSSLDLSIKFYNNILYLSFFQNSSSKIDLLRLIFKAHKLLIFTSSIFFSNYCLFLFAWFKQSVYWISYFEKNLIIFIKKYVSLWVKIYRFSGEKINILYKCLYSLML